MTTDEQVDRKIDAADEEPQPRTDLGAQWTAWQLAERYNLCMQANGVEMTEFTWQEILMLDGYRRSGIELRCLDDVEQHSELLGPNTKVEKKKVKAALKRANDPRGLYIEAPQAKIDALTNPPVTADDESDDDIDGEHAVDTTASSSEPLVVEPEPQDDPDDLGVGEYLDELQGRDWSQIDTWLNERVAQFKERNFDPKEPNDAVSALRNEIADLEVEFARLVLFELAAPSDQLFPDYRSKLRQTLLLEELLKHDERYMEIMSSGEQSDVDNLPFRAGQAARALTYGNRRLNEGDDYEGRDQLPIISFVDERRGRNAPADTSNSDEPEETPPTTPDEPEPPEASEPPVGEDVDDEPELDLVLVDPPVDTSNSDEPEETPPTTPDEPEPTTVVVIEPPAPEPVVGIADVEPEPPEASEPPVGEDVDDEPELNDVDDDSELLAELDGLLTSGRARVAEMAELGFTA